LDEGREPQLRKIETLRMRQSSVRFLTMSSFHTISKKFLSCFAEEDDRYVRVAGLIIEQLLQPSALPEDHPRHPHNRYTEEDAMEHLYKDLKQSMRQEGLHSLRHAFFHDEAVWAEEVDWLLCAFTMYTEGDPNWDGPWLAVEAGQIPDEFLDD
jgi:hypothetical protein